VGIQKAPDRPRELRYAAMSGARVTCLGGNQGRMELSNIQANPGGCRGRSDKGSAALAFRAAGHGSFTSRPFGVAQKSMPRCHRR
jgi:hypothetical protein